MSQLNMKLFRCFIQRRKHNFQVSIRTSAKSATSVVDLQIFGILMQALVLFSFGKIYWIRTLINEIKEIHFDGNVMKS